MTHIRTYADEASSRRPQLKFEYVSKKDLVIMVTTKIAG